MLILSYGHGNYQMTKKQLAVAIKDTESIDSSNTGFSCVNGKKLFYLALLVRCYYCWDILYIRSTFQAFHRECY